MPARDDQTDVYDQRKLWIHVDGEPQQVDAEKLISPKHRGMWATYLDGKARKLGVDIFETEEEAVRAAHEYLREQTTKYIRKGKDLSVKYPPKSR